MEIEREKTVKQELMGYIPQIVIASAVMVLGVILMALAGFLPGESHSTSIASLTVVKAAELTETAAPILANVSGGAGFIIMYIFGLILTVGGGFYLMIISYLLLYTVVKFGVRDGWIARDKYTNETNYLQKHKQKLVKVNPEQFETEQEEKLDENSTIEDLPSKNPTKDDESDGPTNVWG